MKANFLRALASMAVLALAMPGLAAQEELRDGVLHVINGAQPAGGVETIGLEESWRAGGEDGEDFFGIISQVVVADDGTVYLLDTRLSEVPVYSPDGERIATLSREGEGPGEVRIPSGLLLMPDGNLGIVQIFPGKIVKIGTDGTPAGVVQPGSSDPTQGGFMQLFDCVNGGSRLIAAAESVAQNGQTAQTRTNFVAAFDDEGNETVRFWEHPRELDFTKFVFDEDERERVDFRKLAVGPDGRVYAILERNSYRITVFTADGNTDRVIERSYEHRPREAEEIERMETVLASQLRQLPNPKISISKTYPDLTGLTFGPDGNLWVSTSRSGIDQPEGVFFTWDVFTPDGEFIKQVAAECPGDGDNDILIWTPAGHAVRVTGFTDAIQAFQNRGAGGGEEDEEEAAPMEVIYYTRVGA